MTETKRTPAPTPPSRSSAATAPQGAFRELPLGAVRPRGWLLDQLRLQADGLTGHMDEMWPDVGPNSAWLGGSGEQWERGPYYLDGLVPLAHLLNDPGLLVKAQTWIEALLASQRDDGFFGPPVNDDWWPRMVALKALAQHFEATGDERIPAFMTRYFSHQLRELPARPLTGWGQARGSENALVVLWLFERTKESWLLDLARLLLGQSLDWPEYLTTRLPHEAVTSFDHFTHVVNVAMGLKQAAVSSLLGAPGLSGADGLASMLASLENLDRHHGMLTGMFSGDEWLAGLGPQRGVELCAVVELMFTLEQGLRVFGDPRLADRLERVAYNALPATMSADLRTHQYHQQTNQALATIAQRAWTFSGDDANIFGLEPYFGCCAANLHQGWPKLVRSMWLATPDDGLAAVVHGPSEVSARLSGVGVRITTETSYPFDGTLLYRVATGAPVRFPLELRIPEWCAQPRLSVNGQEVTPTRPRDGFARLEREWRDGDVVELVLPMLVRSEPRPGGAVGLLLGPLALALSPGEVWTRLPDSPGFGDFEVRPRRSWNYALETERLQERVRVERFKVPPRPFSFSRSLSDAGVEGAPLRVIVPARRLPEWGYDRNSAAPPSNGPVHTTQPTHFVHLIPYGCARLRIAEFPVVDPSLTEKEPHL